MDDLDMLARLLTRPEPSPAVVARSRRLLREAMREPARRRGGWPARLGLAGAIAIAAVVAVVAWGPGTGSDSPPSADEILLAAATTAQSAPAGAGTYWHVRTVSAGGGPRYETWTRRDGRTWLRGRKTGGDVVELTEPAPFRLAGEALTLRRLQGLPTGAAALKAWIVDAVRRGAGRTSAGRPDGALARRAVLASLTALVSQLPAPPAVRAAAFRAIAALPHVTSAGAVAGGQALRISAVGRRARLVIDPTTSRVHGTSFLVTADGAELWLPAGHTATVAAGWTDRPPPGTR